MSYDHRQQSPMFAILLAAAVVVPAILLIVASLDPDGSGAQVEALVASAAASAGLLFGAFSMRYLRVADMGDHLLVRFGPVPLGSRRIAYRDVTGVRTCRTSFWDGWGAHYRIGRGWIYNLWGYDCVEVQLDRRSARIGTDEPARLKRFLDSKTTASPVGRKKR